MHAIEFRNSRREFLQGSTLAVAGWAWGSIRTAGIAQEANERFSLSLHQYSLKPLFDAGEIDLLGYPKFAKEKLGISNIEFAAEFCADLFAAPEKADEIRMQAKQVGVSPRVLLCADGQALDSATSPGRSAALIEHLQWATVAEHLGCESIRVRASTPGDRGQQLANAAEGIGALCDALQSRSSRVSVLIENIAGFSRDPDWLVELVEKIGSERVGLVADFGNFDGDLYAGMRRILPLTKSICTKSWEFDADGNETKIDFKRMMKLIKDSQFRGCIAIEYLGTEPVAGIRQTAALVRRFSEQG